MGPALTIHYQRRSEICPGDFLTKHSPSHVWMREGFHVECIVRGAKNAY